MNEFTITTDYINLLQLLKAINIAFSGGEAKEMIDDKEVKINDEIENRYRRKLYDGDIVKVLGNEIIIKKEK